MLGEKLGEASGKMTGLRVLSAEGPMPKVEVSFQGRGTLLGQPITDIGTYWQTIRPGGILYGEGTVVMMTQNGQVTTWSGFGVGRPPGAGFKANYAVCGSFQGPSPELAPLNGISNVCEYNVQENGDYRWEMWEWKPGAG